MANDTDGIIKELQNETHSLFRMLPSPMRVEYLDMMRNAGFCVQIVGELQTVHEAMLKHEEAERKTTPPLEEKDFLVIMEQGYTNFRAKGSLDEETLDLLADFIFGGFMQPKNPAPLRFHFLRLIAGKHFSEDLTKRFNHLLFKTATPETLDFIRIGVQKAKGFDA